MDINMWAVVGAAVANIVIGSLWYGPLFGKMWMKMMGFTRESMKSMKMTAGTAMLGGLVSSLVLAYVLAHFADVWGALEMRDGTQLAFWVWLGFVATTQLAGVLWEGRSWKLFCFNAAESLISLVVMAWILVRWI